MLKVTTLFWYFRLIQQETIYLATMGKWAINSVLHIFQAYSRNLFLVRIKLFQCKPVKSRRKHRRIELCKMQEQSFLSEWLQ